MHIVTLDSETDFEGWRNAARSLVLNDVSPADVMIRYYGDKGTLKLGWEDATYSADGGIHRDGSIRGENKVEPIEQTDHWVNWYRCMIDTGHLAENLIIQLRLIAKGSWWPLDVLAALLLLAMMAAGLHSVMRKNEAVRRRLRAVLADDTVILAIAAAGIAALNFALAVSVSHVRLNGYDSRYLTLTNLFGPLGGLLTAFLLLKATVAAPRKRYLETASVVGAMVWLAVAFPKARLSLAYLETEGTAHALALKAPHAVLMGSYWDTYVFTALQGDAAMVPVPLEDSVTRTPWTKEAARRANHVILACPRSSPAAPVSPPQTLEQYGRIFTLADPHWHESRDYAFALYLRQRH